MLRMLQVHLLQAPPSASAQEPHASLLQPPLAGRHGGHAAADGCGSAGGKEDTETEREGRYGGAALSETDAQERLNGAGRQRAKKRVREDSSAHEPSPTSRRPPPPLSSAPHSRATTSSIGVCAEASVTNSCWPRSRIVLECALTALLLFLWGP